MAITQMHGVEHKIELPPWSPLILVGDRAWARDYAGYYRIGVIRGAVFEEVADGGGFKTERYTTPGMRIPPHIHHIGIEFEGLRADDRYYKYHDCQGLVPSGGGYWVPISDVYIIDNLDDDVDHWI